MGHVILKGTQSLGKEKIKPILSFLLPKTLKQIWKFLEIIGFYYLGTAKYNVIA